LTSAGESPQEKIPLRLTREPAGSRNGPRSDSWAASLTEIAGLKVKVAADSWGGSGLLNAFNLRN
jgi:hypothetical protein